MKTLEARSDYPQIEYQSLEYNLDDIKRMQKTPIPPDAGTGSQWENVGAKVDLKYSPEEIATQPDLTLDEQRQRIQALHKPFNDVVNGVIGTLAYRTDTEIHHALARLRLLRSRILEGEVVIDLIKQKP